ncbi:uncharacterized protein LOC125071001 [Vanessa atalanta]|uniref:uncharacterized protein LOC125071001 n=1 Tax=Vanessa atalanta TaxID=42275 RepID=UPI001FCD9C99|nr:uncharacterized protein LOC125071001 [Vanessa atalanta]
MLGLVSILLVVGVHAAVGNPSLRSSPPYVQSKASFQSAKLYLKENIPYDNRNITHPEFRRHAGYGMIAAVTSKLVEAHLKNVKEYDPLKVLDDNVPVIWQNYNGEASKPVNSMLAEAQAGIQPVTTLIDALCLSTDDIDACNDEVESKVAAGGDFLRNRANMLLQLGVVSDIIRNHANEINDVVSNDQQIPYLLHNVNSRAYNSFVVELTKLYGLLRKNSH